MGAGASLYIAQIKHIQEKVIGFPDGGDVTTLEEARKQLVTTRNMVVHLYKLYQKNKFKEMEASKQIDSNDTSIFSQDLVMFFCFFLKRARLITGGGGYFYADKNNLVCSWLVYSR